MHPLVSAVRHRLRSGRRWLGLVAVCAAAGWTEGRAVDLSGRYVDPGIAVDVAAGHERVPVSLRALLSQDFDPVATLLSYARSARIEVTQSEAQLELIVRDLDGVVKWKTRWERGTGFVVDGERVNVLFPAKHDKFDQYVFSLSNTEDRRLLRVEVRRITASLFGPSEGPVTAYLFYRLPEGEATKP